jgi:glycosyltransferase A (GT-A) superfamily protein (DUF2064 family)
MRTLNASLFEAIEWGSDRVCADTLRIASAHGLNVTLAPPLYDIDTRDDVERLSRDLAASSTVPAFHAREWFRTDPVWREALQDVEK